MHRLRLNSDFLTNIIEGENVVIFDFNGKTFMYERLGNTIHYGVREELEKIAEKAESVSYRPAFEAESIIRDLSGKIQLLTLSVTEACNLECSYCFYSSIYPYQRTQNNKRMSLETAKEAIDLLAEYGDENATLTFYGGEPTLYWNFMKECMDYASALRKDIRFLATTNGTRFLAIVQEVNNYNIRFTISLDGPKEIHDKYRRTHNDEPTFDTVIRGIEAIRKYDPEFAKSHLAINATCWDTEDFPKIMDFNLTLDGLFADQYFGFVDPIGMIPDALQKHSTNYRITDDFLRYGLLYVDNIVKGLSPPNILKKLFERKFQQIYYLSNEVMPHKLSLEGSCLPGEFTLFSDASGKFFICEKLAQTLSIGDIKNGVINAKKVEVLEQLSYLRGKNCSDCWLARLCRVCISGTQDIKGRQSIDGLASRCSNYKHSFIIALALYGQMLLLDTEQRHIDYMNQTGSLEEFP